MHTRSRARLPFDNSIPPTTDSISRHGNINIFLNNVFSMFVFLLTRYARSVSNFESSGKFILFSSLEMLSKFLERERESNARVSFKASGVPPHDTPFVDSSEETDRLLLGK